MQNPFKPGQIVRHESSNSVWVIVDVSNPQKPRKDLDGINWGTTITVVGNCLYTGHPDCDYWKPGSNDIWFIDVDRDGKTKYFSDQWKIIARV